MKKYECDVKVPVYCGRDGHTQVTVDSGANLIRLTSECNGAYSFCFHFENEGLDELYRLVKQARKNRKGGK